MGIGIGFGVLLGLVAAVRRGWIEELVMRFADFTFAFPALLSAIMSTASGTLLAPSITLTENVLREFFPMTDRQLLLATRVVVVCFTCVVTVFALMSQGTPI